MTLDEATRIIVVRRGHNMRMVYPMTQYGLDTTSPPELALSAAMTFMQLQAEFPGRADMPITSKTGQMALFLPFMDNPLDDDQPLWTVLAGHWTMVTPDVLGTSEDDPSLLYPAVILNLRDVKESINA